MTLPTWPVVSATGHRPQHLARDSHAWIRHELRRIATKLRADHGTHTAISGMALGVDQWWADAALEAGLQLWAYIPCPQQADPWTSADRDNWKRLLRAASHIRYFGDHYHPSYFHARNRSMLVDSSAVIAVRRTSRTQGGTATALAAAKGLHRPMVRVDPDVRRVSLAEAA